jgi:hypothetical protein
LLHSPHFGWSAARASLTRFKRPQNGQRTVAFCVVVVSIGCSSGDLRFMPGKQQAVYPALMIPAAHG